MNRGRAFRYSGEVQGKSKETRRTKRRQGDARREMYNLFFLLYPTPSNLLHDAPNRVNSGPEGRPFGPLQRNEPAAAFRNSLFYEQRPPERRPAL